MPDAEEIIESFPTYTPLLITLAVVAVAIVFISWYYRRREKLLGRNFNFSKPIVMLCLMAISIIAVIIALPVKDGTKDQLIGVFGLVLTGIIGLSSTTFVSNAMAGFMIRSIRSFRTGDFIRVGPHIGRVSARGLFHTEIQTEDRDLTTLPNLFLVTNPISVVRSSGTIISATISLGYDVSPQTVEPLLIQAAEEAGLEEPFMRVLELGDFSVSYRISGMLTEVKHLVSKRSELRIKAMNTLHKADIEILSPTAVMQRPLKDGQRILPTVDTLSPDQEATTEDLPESRIFDKAEQAEAEELSVLEKKDLLEQKAQLQEQLKKAPEEEKAVVEKKVQEVDSKIETIEKDQSKQLPSS